MCLGTLGRVMVLVAIAVIAGVGLCLFDAADVPGGDLCASSFTVIIGLLLPMPLAPMGRFLPAPVPAYWFSPSDLPSPPPRA